MGEPTDKQAIGMSPENPIDETALEPTDAGHENQQPQPNDQQDHNGEMVQQVVIDSSDDEENIDQEAEETASRAKSPMTTEESAETATAEALGEILDKMPDKLFGINIKQGSTATFANQWVMIGSCFDQAKNFEEIREELNDLRGIMKCFNSSAATAMRSEKAKNEAIREETRKQVNNWMADILEDINTGERARNLRVEEALHKLSGPQDDGTTSLAKSNRPQDEEVEEKKKADQEEQGATDRKRSLACTVDKFTIPKKAQKMERPQPAKQNEDQNSMIMVYKQALETAKFIKATKDRKKTPSTSCSLCQSSDHMEHLCDQYVGVEARTIRMISLDICFTCGNKHKAKCRHATSLPCRICKKRHLTALCPLMDVENNENELNQAKTNPI